MVKRHNWHPGAAGTPAPYRWSDQKSDGCQPSLETGQPHHPNRHRGGARGLCLSIDPQDQCVDLKCAKHQRHAVLIAQMGGSLVPAADQIELDNTTVIKDEKRIHALGRHVDTAIPSCSCDTEQLLPRNECFQRPIKLLTRRHCKSPVLMGIYHEKMANEAISRALDFPHRIRHASIN